MQLLVNDVPCDLNWSPETSLQQVAQRICPSDAQERHIVVTVRCNGQEVSDNELESALARPVAEFNEVAFHTLPVNALVAQSLRNASSLLDSADAARTRAADLIIQGRERDSLAPLKELFDHWNQAQKAFILCVETMNAHGLGHQWDAQLMGEIKSLLLELQQALRAKDLVAVGDALNFELPARFERWKEAVEKLRFALEPC